MFRRAYQTSLTLIAVTCTLTGQCLAGDKFQLELVYTMDKPCPAWDLELLPGGQRALLGNDQSAPQLMVWNIESQKIEQTIEQMGVFIAVSADGKRVACTDFSSTAKVRSIENPEEPALSLLHGEFVVCVAFSPDGSRVATGSFGGSVCVWDAKSGDELLRFRNHGGALSNVVYSTDGKRLISSSADKTIRVWNAETGEEYRKIPHDEWVWSMVVTPDGKHFLSGAGGPMFGNPIYLNTLQLDQNPIRVWNAETGELVRELLGHTHVVRSVDISHDGALVCSGGFDHTLRLWDFETGKELALFQTQGFVTAVRFSADGQFILCGGGQTRMDNEWTVFPEERFRLFKIVKTPEEAAK